MGFFISASLLVVGIVHLLPLSGVVGSTQLENLYAVRVPDTGTELLLRHRAVLFGLLGVFFVYGAFRPELQSAALLIALVSVSTFILLAWTSGPHSGAIMRVVWIDTALVVPLVISLGAVLLEKG